MPEFTIYVHTFPNSKKYVGATSQPLNRRWRGGKGYEGQPVYDAILKYGWDNIKHEILFTGLTKGEAEQKEMELINTLGTNRPKKGYNIENGGSRSNLNEYTKDKLSKAMRGKLEGEKHWNYGNRWSDEVKQKMSNSHKGMKMSEGAKQKLRNRFSGTGNPMHGIKMTKEHKEKLQSACVKSCSKPVICIESGMIYSSGAEAQRKTGICARQILYCCNKKRYKTAGGDHWEFYFKVGEGQ